MKKLIALIMTLVLVAESIACTSAIISGRLTPDGRPLLWKHRDTGELNNRMEWFKGAKYPFLALVNSPDNGGVAWCGSNDAGFSIMNTASFNLKDDEVKVDNMGKEGEFMFKALGECANIADFEKFLNKMPRPMLVESNFGVIDALGGAAYYEVNNNKWVKVDANDPRVAPHGYLIYTNFSYTGEVNKGLGYIRFDTADKIMREQAKHGGITPFWVFDKLSRSFYNSMMDIDMRSNNSPAAIGTGMIPEQDFIPRKETSSSVVIQGLKKGDAANQTIVWSMLGYPPVALAIPMLVKAADRQPTFMMKSGEKNNSEMCDLSLDIKSQVYSIKRGSGQKYLNFGKLYNAEGTGFMQVVSDMDGKNYDKFNKFIEKSRENAASTDFTQLDKLYDDAFVQFKNYVESVK